MGLFSKLGRIFGIGKGNATPSGGGFWQRRREAREERRRERAAKRSERRMDKMEKQRRKEEEARQKREDERKKREAHEAARNTFKDRWGFSDQEYDGFIQFVSSIPDELKEVFGSENLVEAFRTGKSLGLNPSDMKAVLDQTYAGSEAGTQEDIINDLYYNMEMFAQEKGAHV